MPARWMLDRIWGPWPGSGPAAGDRCGLWFRAPRGVEMIGRTNDPSPPAPGCRPGDRRAAIRRARGAHRGDGPGVAGPRRRRGLDGRECPPGRGNPARRDRVRSRAMVAACAPATARRGRLDFGRRLLAVDPLGAAVSPFHGPALHPRRRLAPGRRSGCRPAIDACRAVLRLDPTHLEARRLLIVGAATTGDLPLARAEFRIYLGFNPPDAVPLRRWLDGHADRSSPAR